MNITSFLLFVAIHKGTNLIKDAKNIHLPYMGSRVNGIRKVPPRIDLLNAVLHLSQLRRLVIMIGKPRQHNVHTCCLGRNSFGTFRNLFAKHPIQYTGFSQLHVHDMIFSNETFE